MLSPRIVAVILLLGVIALGAFYASGYLWQAAATGQIAGRLFGTWLLASLALWLVFRFTLKSWKPWAQPIALFAALAVGLFSILSPAERQAREARVSGWNCEAIENGAAETTRSQGGTNLDEVTTFERMQANCNDRTVSYFLTAAVDESSVDGTAWDAIFQDFNQRQCANPQWRPLIDAGWQVQNVYTFADGGTRSMVAACL